MSDSEMAVTAPGFDSTIADIAAGDPIVNDESSDEELPLAKKRVANGKRVGSLSSSDEDRPLVSRKHARLLTRRSCNVWR